MVKRGESILVKNNVEILEEATEFLCHADKDLATIIQQAGACLLQVERDVSPYEALVKAIAGQQLHEKAAKAILKRLEQLNGGGLPEPETLLSYSEEQLRSCGFSFRKIKTLQDLATATIDGVVPDYATAQGMSDQALIDKLTQLHGIGQWTVEMLLIFTLGRLDVMPTGDFGVREGWRVCKGLSEQPKPKLLHALTLGWRPYRSVGAWYLWCAVDQNKPKEK